MKHLFAVAIALAVSLPAVAAPSAEDEARELLHLMHADATVMASVPRIIASMREVAPQVPEAFWDGFVNELNGESFIDLLVPIYVDHFSLAELKKLKAFYRSPTGAKIAELTPQMQAESMEAGRRWGIQIGERVMQKLTEEAPPAVDDAPLPAPAE